tara:strand:- start:555 stop:1043 length:489 start_codon:yes stop_codon:yes gene_type:complete
MKDKKGRDTQVEFQGDKTSKGLAKLPKSRPKGIGKVYSNQPIRKPTWAEIRKPAWADSKVADAVKRTKKSQSLELKKGIVTKRKGSGEGTLKIINPEDELKKEEKRKKLREEKKKKNQMDAHQKRKDKLRNQGKPKVKASPKAKFHDAVFKTISGKPKKLKT